MTQQTRSIIAISVTALLLLALVGGTACTRRGGIGGREVGAVVGGAAGGVAGSQFGSGSGKTAATIAGVLIGAAVGSVVGEYMTRQDRAYMSRSLEQNRPGQTSTWSNPETGYNYRVTPRSTYVGQQGRTCRDFNQVILADGRRETVSGTACKTPQGRWEIVSTN